MKYTFTTAGKRLLSDLHTPVSIYLKVRDIYPESVLLESSDFHGNENSLSYIALQPISRFEVKDGVIRIHYPDDQEEERLVVGKNSVADEFNRFLGAFSISGERSDVCGLFGYTSFDAVRYFEKVDTGHKPNGLDDIPELLYILYKYIIVIDHFKSELTLVELLQDGELPASREIEAMIENRNYASYNFELNGQEHSPITDEEYRSMVRQGVNHCLRGDVFQIVLSRRFAQPFLGDDFKVYRALRSVNPSPYLFYFDFGAFRIFGSSPETHCRITGGRASIDPIAGTYRRTGDTVRDKELVEKLLQDPKENAEHVMLVDLARNDLSRNAEEVSLDFYKEVQYYSHVIHLVSRVSGNILPGSSAVKTFVDTFPAGTLSGAPKVRAMQLISDIERHDRGIYGGCIGFIGFNGDLNQAITIRSFVSRGNELYFQAGAGVVAKSNDESELQEVDNKLGALRKAILLAGELKN